MTSFTRKFGPAYKSVSMALTRMNYKNPGTIASYLLEGFLLREGKLYAKEAQLRGLIVEGEFTTWRKQLIKDGFLEYDFNFADDNKYDRAKHRPGWRIIDILNKEKSRREVLATESYVDRKVEQLEKRVSNLEVAIFNHIEDTDPPATKEKIEKWIVGSRSIQ